MCLGWFHQTIRSKLKCRYNLKIGFCLFAPQMHVESPPFLENWFRKEDLRSLWNRKGGFGLGRLENWGVKSTKRSSSSCSSLRGKGAEFKSFLPALVISAFLHSTRCSSGWKRCWKVVWRPELGRKGREKMKGRKRTKERRWKQTLFGFQHLLVLSFLDCWWPKSRLSLSLCSFLTETSFFPFAEFFLLPGNYPWCVISIYFFFFLEGGIW